MLASPPCLNVFNVREGIICDYLLFSAKHNPHYSQTGYGTTKNEQIF